MPLPCIANEDNLLQKAIHCSLARQTSTHKTIEVVATLLRHCMRIGLGDQPRIGLESSHPAPKLSHLKQLKMACGALFKCYHFQRLSAQIRAIVPLCTSLGKLC
jgi:hypothetical protein